MLPSAQYSFLFIALLSLIISYSKAFHSPSTKLILGNKKCTTSTSIKMSLAHHETAKEIYNVPNSGWSSPQWNWGSAQGTGHDCAMICRRLYDTKADRQNLVQSLLEPVKYKAQHPETEVTFEEIKLILGLAWQKGRWDGSDGGPDGYSHVLQTMASARRYENEDEVLSAFNFIEDISERFHTIRSSEESLTRMKSIVIDVREKHDAGSEEVFLVRRICAGMVLYEIGFVENGL